ncbi:hypothetical protein, partial [Nocardiopsis eucommiae]|uniref:hypothetical protein n=1 Tax=Nocardiopsis eucommiae TaxID=2831970 RepID=UPI003D713FBA
MRALLFHDADGGIAEYGEKETVPPKGGDPIMTLVTNHEKGLIRTMQGRIPGTKVLFIANHSELLPNPSGDRPGQTPAPGG